MKHKSEQLKCGEVNLTVVECLYCPPDPENAQQEEVDD
jgi:hypothetical protein